MIVGLVLGGIAIFLVGVAVGAWLMLRNIQWG